MCEYCGCRSIEVIGLFSREHDDVLTRLGNFGRACDSGDLEAVGRTGVALAEMLWPNTKAEETGLFHDALINVCGDVWERITARTREFDHAAGAAHSHDDEEDHSHGHDHDHAH